MTASASKGLRVLERERLAVTSASTPMPATLPAAAPRRRNSTGESGLDVVVIGAGIGGLVTASQLAAKGAQVLVLVRYLIPGGSGGSFQRAGYTFDVGASMIFGFGSPRVGDTS